MKYFLYISLSLLFLTACENDINEVNRLFSTQETQVETAIGVEMLYSDSAILNLRIVAPKMVSHFQDKDPWQEFPEGLEIDFYDKTGTETTARMTAKYAQRFDKDSKFVVRDSVVWHGEKGEKLETEELIWEEENDRVHTNKFVVVSRPSEVIYGHGFESNKDFTNWTIRAIEGRIKNKMTKDFKN